MVTHAAAVAAGDGSGVESSGVESGAGGRMTAAARINSGRFGKPRRQQH